MTRYVVLTFHERGHDVETWKVARRIEASSAEAAIRAAKAIGGTWVAVPERSWQPLTVSTEQKTVTRIAAAEEGPQAATAAATTTQED